MTKVLEILAVGLLGVGGIASAATITTGTATVNANNDIYYAGQSQNPSDDQLGTVPPAAATIDLSGSDFVSFSSVTGSNSCTSLEGCITINGGTQNDPDGVGAAPSTSSETGANGISGMTAPDAGYLVGVFIDGPNSGSAPANLDFTGAGGTSFSSLSPLLDQVFFIGDGLTGDGTGSVQQFYVPTGATTLVLGISDACSYSGIPGCYVDNSGTYTANYSLDTPDSTAPEPASLLMLFGGIGLVAASRRKLAH